MTYDELASLIGKEVANSIGYMDSKLADQRREAMDYYLGRPFGNEVEGRSQFVSRDVADTVEGIMPSIMRIFTASDEIVKFEPQNMKDEAGAQQATDYVNYLFNRQANGFVVLYTFFKDALLQKNGFCKVYWDDAPVTTVEEYEIDPQYLPVLMAQFEQAGLQAELSEESYGNKVSIKITDPTGKLCIDPIPPEEMRVNKNASWDLQKCRFVAHERVMSASELREHDIDPEELQLAAYDDLDWNQEKLTRFQQDQSDFLSEDAGHEPNKEYLIRECYMLVDWDGDGIAERRMVWEAGNRVLQKTDGEWCNYEIDRVPIVTTTPILMPHKLYGMSIADLVSDLQLLKSTILRQILDNLYLSNNSRMMALDGMVNIDDLLTVRPGGIVRVKTFDAVKPMQVPFFGAPAFQMLSYVDQIREVRSGQRHFQGVDPDAINKDISGVALDKFTAASMEKIELIARIFAETGVKEMMWQIYKMVQQHVKKQQIVRLRDTWIPVDPRSWSNKMDMTVNVGLGTGSRDQLLRGAQIIGQIQLEMVKGGMMGRTVTEQNLYNFGREVSEAVMPKKSELFFTNPQTQPPPAPPKPDEKAMVQMEKAKMADKTKRDLAAVEFLKFVSEQAKPDRSVEVQRETQFNDQSFQRQLKSDEQGFARQQQDAQQEHERDMKLSEHLMQQLATTQEQFNQALQQMLASQQAGMQMMQQLAKIASSERELVTDDQGNPVRSRIVRSENAEA